MPYRQSPLAAMLLITGALLCGSAQAVKKPAMQDRLRNLGYEPVGVSLD
jgi:hypothetical protein